MRDTIRKSANRYARPARRTTPATDRLLAARLVASTALRDNRCPTCGGAVRINLSLTGWVQCRQFGAVGFRADANRASCDWQGFTE